MSPSGRALLVALALLGLPGGAWAADPVPRFRGTIVFMGTSLTAGYGVAPGQAWPERIAGWIGEAGLGYRATNLGVTGETSDEALARLDSVLRQPMSLLVVETGANDFLRGVKPEVLRANLTTLLDRVRARAPTLPIVIVGMAGLGRPGAADGEGYRQVYADVAAARALPLVPSLLDGVAYSPVLNQRDLIHPNAAGHERLAANVWAVLRPLLEVEPEAAAAPSTAELFPSPETPEAPVDGPPPAEAPRRSGYPVGPVWVVPRFSLGTIGLDTNVFYTPTERVTDFTANGGPGLDLVRPLGAHSEAAVGGDLRYTFFLRTESQRRLRGGGEARLRLTSPDARSSFRVRQALNTYFDRPDATINRRIGQEVILTDAALELPLAGPLSLAVRGQRQETTASDEEGPYLGVDLARRLGSTMHQVTPGLRYHLSDLTTLGVEAQRTWRRVPGDLERDLVIDRYQFRADILPVARLSLAVGLGLQRTRAENLDLEARTSLYSSSMATLRLGVARLGADFERGRSYSPFVGAAALPTVETESYGPRLGFDLSPRLNLDLRYRYSRSTTDGVVDVLQPDGSLVNDVRRDTHHAAQASLGFLVRERLRLVVSAGWDDRRSNVSDFGFDGLLAGATLQYLP